MVALLKLLKKYICTNTLDFLKHIKGKPGKAIVTVVKSFEYLKMKYEKILLDIKFIKTYKQGNHSPTFVKVHLSMKK